MEVDGSYLEVEGNQKGMLFLCSNRAAQKTIKKKTRKKKLKNLKFFFFSFPQGASTSNFGKTKQREPKKEEEEEREDAFSIQKINIIWLLQI